MRQQGLLYRQKIEEDNVMKTLRIEALEKEVESLKKKNNEERELRKTAEANHLKVKEELARVHEAKISEAALLKKKVKKSRLAIATASMAPVVTPSFRRITTTARSWIGCLVKFRPWKVT